MRKPLKYQGFFLYWSCNPVLFYPTTHVPMSVNSNDLLLILFVLVTVPCFCYWMGYRSGEKSGQLKVFKNLEEKEEA